MRAGASGAPFLRQWRIRRFGLHGETTGAGGAASILRTDDLGSIFERTLELGARPLRVGFSAPALDAEAQLGGSRGAPRRVLGHKRGRVAPRAQLQQPTGE